MSSTTSLGRVQPLYKGTYVHGELYHKMDNVYYEGNTWVCMQDNVRNVRPEEGSDKWQLVAHKGDVGPQGITGSFGAVTANASIAPTGSQPSVNVITGGPDTAKTFDFHFDIPAGPLGFDDVDATASALAAQSPPTATASLYQITQDEQTSTILKFDFGIPMADGTGIKSIDGDIYADASGNAELTAVRYGNTQSLSSAQKLIARQNIGAQESGNYITTAGGVFSGALQIQSNNLEDNLIPEENQVGQTLYFTDRNGAYIGRINPAITSNGLQSLGFSMQRDINGTDYVNSIQLGINSVGGSEIILSNPSAWRSALDFDAGQITPSVDTPEGTIGTSLNYAREDHTHPLNIAKSPVLPLVDGDATLGQLNTYALTDHVHPLNISTALPIMDGAVASAGSGTVYALNDHIHPHDTYNTGLILNIQNNIYESVSSLPTIHQAGRIAFVIVS